MDFAAICRVKQNWFSRAIRFEKSIFFVCVLVIGAKRKNLLGVWRRNQLTLLVVVDILEKKPTGYVHVFAFYKS